jgi:hypothetical protein
MRRAIRILVLVGGPLLALAEVSAILSAGFICYDSCPPESDLASALASRLERSAPLFVAAVVLIGAAWILCLRALARASRWWLMGLLAAALPLVVAVALALVLTATDGKLLPTTWYEHNTGWSGAVDQAAAVLLLWPLATFLATFALRDNRAPVTPA